MKVTIKVKDGENICCNGNSNDSVKELKAVIQEKNGNLVHDYNIIYNGENLSDERLLSDYDIQNDSILLLIDKEKSLLLKSSIIFDNSDLIDRIHQSIFDLKNHSCKDDVLDLLNEAISYLDKDLKPITAIELFSLIISCSLQCPDQSLQLFNKRLQKSNISSYHIISFAKLLSNLSMNFPQLSIKNHNDFISNSFQQILESSDNNLFILGNEIPPHFKDSFITDIILLIEPTEQIVKNFSFYIINPKNDFNIINFFIKKVNDSGLLNTIPDSLLIKNCVYDFLTIENSELIIQSLTKQTFRKYSPFIEKYLKKDHLTSSCCSFILKNLVEYDISLSSDINEILFEKVDDIELDLKMLEYLKSHNIKLPDKFISKIETLPTSQENIKIFLHPEKMSTEHLIQILHNSTEIGIYEVLLSSDKLIAGIFETLYFWKHIMTIVSSTEEKITDYLISRFSFYFKLNNSTQKEIIMDGLIFDEHLPNEKQSNFLFRIFINIYDNFGFFKKPERCAKLLSYNEIPCISLCKLFVSPEDFITRNSSPKELYFYLYTNKRYQLPFIYKFEILYGSSILSFDKIKSFFNKNENENENELLLTQFIKNKNDFSLTSRFDEKLISLVVSSISFAYFSKTLVISGMTKENALPFYAIAFNTNSNCFDIFNDSSDKMINALFSSIQNLGNSNSPLLNESINAILSISSDTLIKIDHFINIFYILCDILIAGKYHADKLLLFNFIFYVSKMTNSILAESFLDIIIQYGIRLFNIIFQNKADIINSKSITYCLDLKVFDPNEIKSYIDKKFDSDDEIFQIIVFYTKYCTNQPILNINNVVTSRITKLYQQNLIDEKWDNFDLIFKFMSINKMNINLDVLKDKQIPLNVSHSLMKYSSYFNDIENYLYQCLTNPEFENEHSIIIKHLLQNKSIIYKYIAASLEVLFPNNFVQGYEEILTRKPYLYKQYKEDLVFVLEHQYDFNENHDLLLRKLNIKQPKLPDIDYSIIEKIIRLNNYKSFICLHHIASCFPFLFENDSIDIVDFILPTLNCLSFIYDDEISEEKTNDLKTAASALSFLYSCLQSTKFISTFVIWLFENIESLNESQIVCMSKILISLYETKEVSKIICGYAIKYNFLDKLNDLLTKDISNEKFKFFYTITLYNLLLLHVKKTEEYSDDKYDKAFINYILRGSLSNPFDIKFNFYSVIPIKFKKISFSFTSENESTDLIENFIDEINKDQVLWLSYKSNVKSEIPDLLKHFNDDQSIFKYDELPQIYELSNQVRCYLTSQPTWVSVLFSETARFPISLEYHSFLVEVGNNAPNDDYDTNYYYESFDESKEIIKTIIKDYLYSEITYEESYSLLILLLKCYKYVDILIKKLEELISEIEFTSTFGLFYKNLAKLLNILFKNEVSAINQIFFKKVGTCLINYFLSPYSIDDVPNISNFLISLNCDLPIQTAHIIERLLDDDFSNFTTAYKLYSKIDKEKASNLIPLFTKIFLKEIQKNDIDYQTIRIFMKEFPSIAKRDVSLYDTCLSKCIQMYENSTRENIILNNFNIELFNFLAPKRDKYQREQSQISDEIDFTQSISYTKENKKENEEEDNNDDLIYFHHVPDQIYCKDVNFWQNIYEKHREFLSAFSTKSESNFEKLTFLHDYYELIPFEIRLSYFKAKMNELLNGKYAQHVDIRVSRSTILEDSFNALLNTNPRKLIGSIRVHFEGESGYDIGGLTSEWFSMVTKEIFDPKYGLFISNENNCYHPNQLSYFNSNHIDYFKLAGKIVALSLLHNRNINAHLSMAFYRQILQQRIKLKDLEDFDHSLFESFESILNIDDVKDLDLVFQIDDDVFGEFTSIDLIENGSNIQVTNDNRMDYVSSYVNYKLRKSVIGQINAFCDFFNEIIPQEFIRMFSPSELDMLICGVHHIDLEDMRKHTHYEPPYHDEHPTIVVFFNVLGKFNQEELAKFLVFLTGSSQVPIGGFKDFEESGNPITINYNNSIERLPVAHTCFRILDLPNYDDENELKRKLLNAINECDDFGLI